MPTWHACRASDSTPGRSAAARMIAVKRSATTSRAFQTTTAVRRIPTTTSVAIATRPCPAGQIVPLRGVGSTSRSGLHPVDSELPGRHRAVVPVRTRSDTARANRSRRSVSSRPGSAADSSPEPRVRAEHKPRGIRPALSPVTPDDNDSRRDEHEAPRFAPRRGRARRGCARKRLRGHRRHHADDLPPDRVGEEPVRQAAGLGEAAPRAHEARRRHRALAERPLPPHGAQPHGGRPRAPRAL